jgi:hypothetical protein
MTTEAQSPQLTWQAANQQYLLGALSNVRIALENHTARNLGEPIHAAREEKKSPWPTDIEILPALETICQAFGLTNFEREILLMAAGMELSSDFDGLFAGANNDTDKAYPTFSLALAALPGAHWSALSPSRPLRHWRLIELQQQENLTSSPLRIDERVLHYLTGVQHLDTRLVGFIETVQPLAGEDPIPIYQDHAERIKSAWAAQTDEANLPVIQLWGSDPAARRSVALEACQKMNLNLHLLRAGVLPAEPREQAALLRLWEREAIFSAGVLLFEIDEDQVEDSAFQRIINRWIESNRTPLIISAREKRSTPHKTMVTIEIPKLDTHEQKYLLEKALGDYAEPLNGEFNAIVTQFQLNPTAILMRAVHRRGRGWANWRSRLNRLPPGKN